MTDPPSPAAVAAARDVLAALARAPGGWPTADPALAELVAAAARVVGRDRKQRRADDRRRDAEARAAAGIRGGPGAAAPLARARACYACRRPYDRLHPFYDALCPACGDLHHAKRQQTADLRGRGALVTGGRVKSGFRVALKLLQAGAEVVCTTRFPADAARRFAAEPDAREWLDRVRLVGLDLRALPAVERFAAELRDRLPFLDIFVANAAQTVRRPPAYYRSLAAAEADPPPALGPAWSVPGLVPADAAVPAGVPWYAGLSLVPLAPGDAEIAHFPPGVVDADGQPADLRPENSWGLPQEGVSTPELVEVHAVNCLAPFLLLRGLRPLFRAGPPRDRFAVMVSAAEGRFAGEKTGRHPHTNMAKAALNMLVRTSAPELAADRVFLTAVDPGWFSVQSAAPAADRFAAQGGRVPLDAEDAAARILDPVFAGIATGRPASGVLFKDYREAAW